VGAERMSRGGMVVDRGRVRGGATERRWQNDLGQNDGGTDDGVWRGDGKEGQNDDERDNGVR
jgi:hypothetical protein